MSIYHIGQKINQTSNPHEPNFASHLDTSDDERSGSHHLGVMFHEIG